MREMNYPKTLRENFPKNKLSFKRQKTNEAITSLLFQTTKRYLSAREYR